MHTLRQTWPSDKSCPVGDPGVCIVARLWRSSQGWLFGLSGVRNRFLRKTTHGHKYSVFDVESSLVLKTEKSLVSPNHTTQMGAPLLFVDL
jgi:hypothetical protein